MPRKDFCIYSTLKRMGESEKIEEQNILQLQNLILEYTAYEDVAP